MTGFEREPGDGFERIEVMRGGHKAGGHELFGPLPGVRAGDAAVYEFELPEWVEPWPGRTRVERVYVLLDLGVSMSNPCWHRAAPPGGAPMENPESEARSWYVDLVTVDRRDGRYVFRDLFIDVRVPMDERRYRMLDLDDFADALEGGLISVEQAVSGLRRWQRFIDRHLHTGVYPGGAWADFPPEAFEPLRRLPGPLAPPVRWNG
jgi:hypothetical protein